MWTRFVALASLIASVGCDEPRLHNPPGYAVIAEAMTLSGGHLIAVGARPGDQGAVLHYDGETWHLLDGGSLTDAVWAVWAASPDSIWISSNGLDQPKLRHWDGAEWHALDEEILGEGMRFESVGNISGSSANDVWFVGDAGDGHALYHWDGTQWLMRDVPRPSDVPAEDGFRVGRIGCSSAPDDVWAFAFSSSEEVRTTWSMHWDGTRWDASRFGGGGVGNIVCRGAQRWLTAGEEDFSMLYQGASAGWTRILISPFLDFIDVAIEGEDRALVTGVGLDGPFVWSVGADDRTGSYEPELTNVLPRGLLHGTPTAIARETDGTIWVFDELGAILEVP